MIAASIQRPHPGELRLAEEQCGISLVGIGVLVAEDEYLFQLLYEYMVERLGGKVLASVGTVD